MAYNKVIEVDKLKAEGKWRTEIEGVAILFIYDAGEVYALQDRCPHLGASLLKGEYTNKVITCAKHGAQIDVTTGDVLEKAKVLFLRMPTKKAKVYKTKIENDFVWIEQ